MSTKERNEVGSRGETIKILLNFALKCIFNEDGSVKNPESDGEISKGCSLLDILDVFFYKNPNLREFFIRFGGLSTLLNLFEVTLFLRYIIRWIFKNIIYYCLFYLFIYIC